MIISFDTLCSGTSSVFVNGKQHMLYDDGTNKTHHELIDLNKKL